MKFCKYCGKQIDIDILTCPHCNRSIADSAVNDEKTGTSSCLPFFVGFVIGCIVTFGALFFIGYMSM